jgi:TIR domain
VIGFIQSYRSVKAIGLISLSLLPAAVGASRFAPPWPNPLAVGFATSLLFVVFGFLSDGVLPEFGKSKGRVLLVGGLLLAASVFFSYLFFFEKFAFRIPTTGDYILTGCGFTSAARDVARLRGLDADDDCPGQFEDLLEGMQYEPGYIWVKSSISAVRFLLLTLWTLTFLLLAWTIAIWFRYAYRGPSAFLNTSSRGFRPVATHEQNGSIGAGRDSGHVFLSYAREDRERAEVFANAFRDEGLAVWWDSDILPGAKSWDALIAERLSSARCVVVLWSIVSIGKDWVREEASQGAKRGALVPVLIDRIDPPLGFGRIQAARMFKWNGDTSDKEFRKLIQAINGIGDKRIW